RPEHEVASVQPEHFSTDFNGELAVDHVPPLVLLEMDVADHTPLSAAAALEQEECSRRILRRDLPLVWPDPGQDEFVTLTIFACANDERPGWRGRLCEGGIVSFVQCGNRREGEGREGGRNECASMHRMTSRRPFCEPGLARAMVWTLAKP